MLFAQTIFMHRHSLVETGFGDDKCTTILILAIIVFVLHVYVHRVCDITVFLRFISVLAIFSGLLSRGLSRG